MQEIIKRNARLEFEAIWRENERTGEPRSVLSDKLSLAITKLDEELQGTELWDDRALRVSVLAEALPKLLVDQIGLETILERVSSSVTTVLRDDVLTFAPGPGELPPRHLRLVPQQPLHLRKGHRRQPVCLLQLHEREDEPGKEERVSGEGIPRRVGKSNLSFGINYIHHTHVSFVLVHV